MRLIRRRAYIYRRGECQLGNSGMLLPLQRSGGKKRRARAKCHICRQRFNYTLQTHDMSKSYTSYRLCHLLKVSSRPGAPALALTCSTLSARILFLRESSSSFESRRSAAGTSENSQKWNGKRRWKEEEFARLQHQTSFSSAAGILRRFFSFSESIFAEV